MGVKVGVGDRIEAGPESRLKKLKETESCALTAALLFTMALLEAKGLSSLLEIMKLYRRFF